MNRPNILFVVMDSVRPEWLSCYHAAARSSPNIDRVARESFIFEQTISASSWTFPAMSSVFTGMVPTKHGGHDESMRLGDKYPTLTEVLQRHGYDTAAFADVPYVGPMTGLDRGFRVMSNLGRDQVSPWSKVLKGIGRAHRLVTQDYRKTGETPVVIGEAMRWLERDRERGKPFFLYIHSDETHAPFLPPARWRKQFTGLSASAMYGLNQDKQAYMSGAIEMTEQDFRDMRDLALAEVAYFDSWLGKLFAKLADLDLYDDLWVVLAADHGENLGDHGLLRHALCLYDTLLRVPLILRVPGRSGAHVSGLTQLIDVMPTLIAGAGIKDPAVDECQGRDLVQAVDANAFADFAVSELYRPSEESRVMWEKKAPTFYGEYLERFDRRLRSWRTATHKLLWSSNGRHELYDLVSDPDERNNVMAEQPDVASRLQADMEAWLATFEHADGPSQPASEADVDDAVMERLRDLGYVD